MNAELTAEKRPACLGIQYLACRTGIRRLTKMREVFKSSSYFLMYSLSNTSDSLRYTAKKSARELFVLNGSKNSLSAEWRLGCEVILAGRESSNETDIPFWVELDNHGLFFLHSVLGTTFGPPRRVQKE